jgi:hypothetical protein
MYSRTPCCVSSKKGTCNQVISLFSIRAHSRLRYYQSISGIRTPGPFFSHYPPKIKATWDKIQVRKKMNRPN